MKTVKPLCVSYIARPYQCLDKHLYGVTVALLVDYSSGRMVLKNEQELWSLFTEESMDVFGADTLDVGVPKPIPELIVNGYGYGAYAQDGMTAVRVELNNIKKTIWVFGDRYWIDGKKTLAKEFECIPISWANAFGGPSYEYNPVGTGIDFVSLDEKGDAKYKKLPNIEDPKNLISTEDQKVEPVSFCSLPVDYPGRNRLMGTYDQEWLEKYAPGFAKDIDWTYFNSSPLDQRLGSVTSGDVLSFINMHPTEQTLRLSIPDLIPKVFFEKEKQPGELYELETKLSTIWAYPHKKQMILLYQASLETGRVDIDEYFKNVMCAVETSQSTRDLEYYRDILKLRAAPRTGPLSVVIDKQLVDTEFIQIAGFKIPGTNYYLQNRLKNLNNEIQERLNNRTFTEKISTAASMDELFIQKKELNKQLLEEVGIGEVFDNSLDVISKVFESIDYEKIMSMLLAGEFDIGELFESFLAIDDGVSLNEIEKDRRKQVKKTREYFAERDNKNLDSDRKEVELINPYQAFPEAENSFEGESEELKVVHELLNINDKKNWEFTEKYSHLVQSANADLSAKVLYDEAEIIDIELIQQIDVSNRNPKCLYRIKDRTFKTRSFKRDFLSLFIFENCHFEGVSFSNKAFGSGKFLDCRFENCLFEDSELKAVVFENCRFVRTRLSQLMNDGMTIFRSHFIDCFISSWIHENIFLDRVVFEKSRLFNLTLTKGYVHNLHFAECELERCSLIHGRYSYLKFSNCELDSIAFLSKGEVKGVEIRESFLDKVFVKAETKIDTFIVDSSFIKHSTFRNLNLNGAVFSDSKIEMNDLSKTSFRNARFNECSFADSLFIDADFNSIIVRHSSFLRALLKGAEIREAVFNRVSFYMADLSLVAMDKTTVIEDSNTKHANFIPTRKAHEF